MTSNELLIGFLIVIIFAILQIFFSTKRIRTKYPPVFRKLQSAIKLRRAIGLAVEDGSRLHISLGSSSVIDSDNSSALVSLSTLNCVEQLASTSDLPPMCTTGSGSFQILSQDITRQHISEPNKTNLTDPNLAYLSGVTPFSYAVGAMDALSNSEVSTNVFAGNFGAEAGLLCEASRSSRSQTIAGSDSITAQSIFFAVIDDALIGEELYALPAYLGSSAAHQASLRVQDALRLLLVLVLVVGVAMKVIGV